MIFETNKAVLEPRVSPAFAITYLCNHCNIRLENTSKYVDTLILFSKNLNQRSLTPDDLWPHVCWGHMCDSTQGSLCPSPMGIHQCMWIEWSILQITTYIHTHTYILRSGVTGGGQSAPQRLLTGKFLLTYGEKVARKKIEKGEGKLKMEGGKNEKIRRGPFFLFVLFCFFVFLLFSLQTAKTVPKWGEDLFFFPFLFTFQNG